MTTKAVIEVAVHLESFRNVDLYYQGLYCLQLKCFRQGQPLSPHLIEKGPLVVPSKHPHHLGVPCIVDHEHATSSRVFLVRYTDEIVKLNEVFIFRDEVELQPPLVLEAELLFSELDGAISTAQLHSLIECGLQGTAFTSVAKASFRIADPAMGVNQFVPIVFHDVYASVVHSTVHCLVMDYKFFRRGQLTSINEIGQLLFPGKDTHAHATLIEQVYHQLVMKLALNHNKARRLVLKALTHAESTRPKQQVPAAIKLPLTVLPLSENEEERLKYPLTSAVSTRMKPEVASIILEELREVAARMHEMRHVLLSTLQELGSAVIMVTEFVYHQNMHRRWKENVTQEVINNRSLLPAGLASAHEAEARRRRESKYFQLIEPLEVEDVEVLPRLAMNPIVFEEVNEGALSLTWAPDWFSSRKYSACRRSVHLLVLVHGFMGTAYDMKFIKDHIYTLSPQTVLYSARANEKDTDGDIEDMGIKLAEEVITYIETAIGSRDLCKLSFLGHSLGGVIIRAAMPLLSKYRSKMNLFMSLNSPHLGCASNSSFLVGAGIWVMSKVKASLCLKQLSLADATSARETYLYRLAHTEGLGWFKYVLLVSSPQDIYVPYESARIQTENPQSVTAEMAHAIVNRLPAARLVRIDASFNLEWGALNSYVGRTAHVQQLDHSTLLHILLYRYAELFVL